MRTLRLSLAGMFLLMLLGGSGGVVLGQDDAADPMAPAFFTYTTEPVGETFMPPDDVVRDHMDMQMVDATDPRASGLITLHVNSNLVALDDGGVMTVVMSERLTNDGGAWAGSGRFVMAGSEDDGMMTSMDVLTGEGRYEGLTIIMGQYASADTMSNWGVIVPSEQVPPMPDPVEPAAE